LRISGVADSGVIADCGLRGSLYGALVLDHVKLHVSDFSRSRAFYEQSLAPLGYRVGLEPGPGAVGFVNDHPDGRPAYDFFLSGNETPVSVLHLAFTARDRATVDAFHAAGLAAGGTDNGGPGLRPQYHQHYYGAFVLDPDGVNVEAVCHLPE
jgi:catechol 2,3-dioxygenase-like lactoylglutathione lyase family enzyme